MEAKSTGGQGSRRAVEPGGGGGGGCGDGVSKSTELGICREHRGENSEPNTQLCVKG